MPIVTPPPDDDRPRRMRMPRPPQRGLGAYGLLAIIPAVLLIGVLYWWFVQRIEVDAGEVVVLMHKVGREIPSVLPDGKPVPDSVRGQVVLYPGLLKALGEDPNSTAYKGILFDVLSEGRHFRDPFFWQRVRAKAQEIKPDEIGILIRKFGRPLPAGRTVAMADDERGPQADVLKPGRYNINPYAYEVRRIKPVVIPAGHVGVQTLLEGREPNNPNQYMVAAGERGVQPDVLPPGMYYNNPYLRRIETIDVRSHTIDMSNDDAIRFPSNDSFDILVDATVEYAVRQDLAPYVMVAIGNHDDVRDKIILPYARSLCRIEGSKLVAREFISGDTRTAFQKKVFEGLREQCYAQGIEIRATLIRRIVPPAEIAGPISDRQVAEQQVKQYENEIKLAEAEAKLVEQQEMQKQNTAVGGANREVVSLVTDAEQKKAVALTEANQRLAVAKLQLEAAKQTAESLLARGRAEAEVKLLQAQAEAEPLRAAVSAFGDGEAYAQFFFYQKLAPAVRSVLASTDGPFADIFRALGPTIDSQQPTRPLPAGGTVREGGAARTTGGAP